MPKTDLEPVTFENAEIIWLNFAGREGPFNAAGNREFTVVIPDEKVAQAMLKDGWNVKYRDPREEGDAPNITLTVSVKFGYRPPMIWMITSRSKVRTRLTEDMVAILDVADIKQVDLTVNPSEWEVNGKTGIKAYLKTMYITVVEDDLDYKYAQVDSADD